MSEDRIAYESIDVEGGGILWGFVGMLILLAGSSVIVWALQSYFILLRGDPRQAAHLYSRADQRAPGLIAEPPLQGTPDYGLFGPAEVAALRKSEERLLSTYGFYDRDQGLVHIPIRQAMQLVVERGLNLQEGKR